MPIITYPLNGIQYLAEDAETYLSTRQSGVYSSDDHFSVSVTDSWQITVSPGLAWINNARFKGKSVVSTEPVTLDIPIADGALNRRDLIVLRFDALNNASVLAVKKGTAASSPAIPDVERSETLYELGLYAVTVPAGSTSITLANIESKMLDESYCGIMRDGVTGIPTAHLQAQAEELMALLRESMGEIVSADADLVSNGGEADISVSLDRTDAGVSLGFRFVNIRPVRGVDYMNEADYDTIDDHIRQIVLEGEW